MSVTGFPQSISFSNIAATTAAFNLSGGKYGVTCMGTSFGTVALSRLAADASTYIPVFTAFAANGYVAVDLPKGNYKVVISSTTAVYIDITKIQ